MKRTRIFTVVFAVALCIICLGLVPTKAHAETISGGTFGDELTWALDNDGTLTISGIGDIPASCIYRAAPWYAQREQIKTIIIEDGITSIPERAFMSYKNLVKVTMGDTVTSIGRSAFWGCQDLSSIQLSKNLTSIADDVFNYCSDLTQIVIPEGVTEIGSYAFSACYHLESITLPSTLTYVKSMAFNSCNSLVNVYISDISAFMNITVENDNNIHIMDANRRDKTLYLNGKPVTELVIPYGISEIGPGAFCGCDFTSVVIPDSVTKIHESAFQFCRSLTNVVIPDQVTEIGACAFAGCEKLTGVTIGKNVCSIGGGAFMDCTQLQHVTIPDSVVIVKDNAFWNCTALKTATIGKGLAQINRGMFSGCSSLVSITIPGNVSTIGERAFEKCSSLTSVTMEEGVTSIDRYVFWRCSSLKQVTFPDSLTVIGRYAFSECSSMKDIVFGTGLREIKEYAFEKCANLFNVEFNDGITTIGDFAFDRCQSYEIIILPASVKTIGTNAFYTAWHILYKGAGGLSFSSVNSGAMESKSIHKNCTGNELKSSVIAPTCTAFGYTAYTCSICNEVRHNQLTDATGHSYGAWYIAEEATFENKGIERRECKNCNKYETKEIPVKRHVDKDNDYVCDVCGNKFCETHTEELLPATNATCTQEGLTEGKKCAHCDAILQAQEVIPAIGHSFGQWTQAETPGVEKRVCDGCGESEQRMVSSPTEPSPSELSSTQPATQTDSCDADKPVDPIVVVLIVTGVLAVAGGAAVILMKKKK